MASRLPPPRSWERRGTSPRASPPGLSERVVRAPGGRPAAAAASPAVAVRALNQRVAAAEVRLVAGLVLSALAAGAEARGAHGRHPPGRGAASRSTSRSRASEGSAQVLEEERPPLEHSPPAREEPAVGSAMAAARLRVRPARKPEAGRLLPVPAASSSRDPQPRLGKGGLGAAAAEVGARAAVFGGRGSGGRSFR